MKYIVQGELLVVRLDPGDDIHGSLTEACQAEGVTSAAVRGVGSVDNPVLAHYRIDHQRFSEKQLVGIYEITALEGNISQFDGQLLVHLHATIADDAMQAYGGHLVSGRCSATAEIFIHRLKEPLTKVESTEIGLKIWDFD